MESTLATDSDYARLTAAQVVVALPGLALDAEGLTRIEALERTGKNRVTVLRRIAALQAVRPAPSTGGSTARAANDADASCQTQASERRIRSRRDGKKRFIILATAAIAVLAVAIVGAFLLKSSVTPQPTTTSLAADKAVCSVVISGKDASHYPRDVMDKMSAELRAASGRADNFQSFTNLCRAIGVSSP